MRDGNSAQSSCSLCAVCQAATCCCCCLCATRKQNFKFEKQEASSKSCKTSKHKDERTASFNHSSAYDDDDDDEYKLFVPSFRARANLMSERRVAEARMKKSSHQELCRISRLIDYVSRKSLKPTYYSSYLLVTSVLILSLSLSEQRLVNAKARTQGSEDAESRLWDTSRLLTRILPSSSLSSSAQASEPRQLFSSQTANELNSTAVNGDDLRLQQQLIRPHQQRSSSATATTTRLSSSGPQPPSSSGASLALVRQKWRLMEQSIGEGIQLKAAELRKTIFDDLIESKLLNHSLTGVSNKCKLALGELLDAMEESKLWAVQMLDSSASSLPSGLFDGTLTELGNFDECLSIGYQSRFIQHHQETPAASQHRSVIGQYCTLVIKPPLIQRPRLHTACRRLASLSGGSNNNNNNLTSKASFFKQLDQNAHQFFYVGLRLGLCTPSACSRSDLQLLLSAHLAKYELIGQVKACHTQHQSNWLSENAQLANLSYSFIAANSLASSNRHHQHPLASFSQFDPFIELFGLRLDLAQKCIVLVFVCISMLTLLGTWLDCGQPNVYKSSLLAARARQLHCTGCWCDNTTNDGPSLSDTVPKGHHQQTVPVQRTRWHHRYRVNGAASSVTSFADTATQCAHNDIISSPSLRSLGPQCNPLANISVASTSDYESTSFYDPTLAKHPMFAPGQDLGKNSNKASFQLNNNNNKSQDHNWIAWMQNSEASKMPSSNQVAAMTLAAQKSHAEKGASLEEFILCFSLKRNFRSIGRLAGQKQANQSNAANINDDIKVIHGLRTLAMIWIIFGHTIGLVGPEMLNNLFALAQLSCSSRLLQAMLNATLAVDTFFMISGLVTMVSFMRKCRSARELLFGPPGFETNSELSRSLRGTGAIASSSLTVIDSSSSSSSELDPDSRQGEQSGGACHGLDVLDEIRLCGISSPTATNNLITGDSSLSGGSCSGSTSPQSQNNEEDHYKSPDKIFSSSSSSTSSNGTDKKLISTSGAIGEETNLGSKNQSTSHQAFWPQDFRPIVWILMRYLRLTPSYAAIIGVSILLPSLNAPGGPFWSETMGQLEPSCRANWWSNLLYVNNFYQTDKLCLIHSWYLSNDFQFFLITLILFGIIYKSVKLALLLVVSVFFASSAVTFAVIVANEFPPTIVTTSPAVAERWQFIYSLYYKPWPHLPSYLIGLFVGYLIIRTNQPPASSIAHPGKQTNPSVVLSSGWRLAGWLFSGALALALLSSIYPWNMGFQVEPLISGLHGSTFRTLWAACNGWLVFALVSSGSGEKNLLGQFLGWRAFQVTSRLTYCAYLVHPLIIYNHFGLLKERMDSSLYGQTFRFMGTLGLSYLFALILSALIESPSIQIQSLFVRLLGGQEKGRQADMVQQQYANLSRTGHWSTEIQGGNAGTSKKKLAKCNQKSTKQTSRLRGKSRKMTSQPTGQAAAQRSSRSKGTESARQASDSSNLSSALDEEFQRKLAQAIGKGFKIRSRQMIIASGHPSQQRRLGPTKRLSRTVDSTPDEGDESISPSMLKHNYPNQTTPTLTDVQRLLNSNPPPPPPPPPPPVPRMPGRSAKRGESFSTFVSMKQEQEKRTKI